MSLPIEIIKPSVEIIEANTPLQKLELCGRVCYKSEDKICDGSAERLINSIIRRGHDSVLEHFRIMVTGEFEHKFGGFRNVFEHHQTMKENHHRRYLEHTSKNVVIGNARAWRLWLQEDIDKKKYVAQALALQYPVLFADLLVGMYFCDNAELKYKVEEANDYMTLRIICDRGISHEIVRHRTLSFSQESTRYCNYSGKPMQFILPIPFDWAQQESSEIYKTWLRSCQNSSDNYQQMLELGCTPQMARSVLNNSLKTEIIVTGRFYDWKGFLNLRLPKDAHPQIRIIAKMVEDNI